MVGACAEASVVVQGSISGSGGGSSSITVAVVVVVSRAM